MNPNSYQIGGSHYKRDYQCWDFIIDAKLNYLLGCTVKYVSRWREKNGIEDLKKAQHYLIKYRDLYEGISSTPLLTRILHRIGFETKNLRCWLRFISDMNYKDQAIMWAIYDENWDKAIVLIGDLINELTVNELLIDCEDCEASLNPINSVNLDNNYFRG